MVSNCVCLLLGFSRCCALRLLNSRISLTAHKIACDKTQPTCQNCDRRGRVCLGYGLKLSWPREDNSKRFISQGQDQLLPIDGQNVHFINASYHDVEASLTGQGKHCQCIFWHKSHRLTSTPEPKLFLNMTAPRTGYTGSRITSPVVFPNWIHF